ncbi:MAG: xanthine phosphoribosyltransferase [Deltaproteobacteria bacterium]|nr:xanthine phosphoribosyltransferase [Deltaproteobacteria bacterium]
MREAAQVLLDRIRRDGGIENDVIKVDHFLNHLVDPRLIDLLAAEFAERYRRVGIDKVLTAEASGIAPAFATALRLGVPFVFAKKKKPLTMAGCYSADSYSFTKQEATTLFVSREVLRPEERILFVDDFLARGATLRAITEIIGAAGAVLAGTAVLINKSERRDVASILTLDDLRFL